MAEHGRRAAIDAFASFVLDSFSSAPLTEARPKLSPAPLTAAAAPAPEARQECSTSTVTVDLPKPQPRIASVSLAPAPAVEIARVNRLIACADVARAKIEARMTLAELRGVRPDRVRRIVVVIPEVDVSDLPVDPATL